MKFVLSLAIILCLQHFSNAFVVPLYKGVGCWNLKGTSSTKFDKYFRVNLHVVPKKKSADLQINWIQQVNVGPVVVKDVIEGEIKETVCNINECSSFYKFNANKYSISIINILGIGLPPSCNIKKPLKKKYNVKNISWEIDGDILFIQMNKDYFVFSRNTAAETMNVIRLDQFIMSQILGYLFVKLIDKLHLLS